MKSLHQRMLGALLVATVGGLATSTAQAQQLNWSIGVASPGVQLAVGYAPMVAQQPVYQPAYYPVYQMGYPVTYPATYPVTYPAAYPVAVQQPVYSRPVQVRPVLLAAPVFVQPGWQYGHQRQHYQHRGWHHQHGHPGHY